MVIEQIGSAISDKSMKCGGWWGPERQLAIVAVAEVIRVAQLADNRLNWRRIAITLIEPWGQPILNICTRQLSCKIH